MLRREVTRHLEEALDRQAAVVLIGPRQVGKTTAGLEIAKARPSLYLDLELPEDRAKLDEPVAFLQRYEDRLVIVDEMHRAPEIFAPLRSLIDQGRRRGNRTGRFLFLGSATMTLLRQSRETLAGRMAILEMTPFLVSEAATSLDDVEQLWLRGGFPESFLAKSESESFRIRRDLLRTYLEREIAEFAPRILPDTLNRLWQMLAHLHGTLVNISRIAAGLGVAHASVRHYIDLFAALFLIRKLPPYHANVGKRLVKASKIFLRDSGFVHALLRLSDYNELAGSPVVGSSWEGFVIENLVALTAENADATFYRTSAGAEIDLILDWGHRGKWAIEIKRSRAPKIERGFFEACNDVQPSHMFVVHAGGDRFPMRNGVEAMSLQEMCQTVRSFAAV